jgi:hypothetical protein
MPTGPGHGLDQQTRAGYEIAFDADLADVRVHTDETAARRARAIGAQAFTSGQSIVFDAGQFQPHASAGRRVLAHELAHVLQQAPRSDSDRRQTSSASRMVEADAEDAADAVLSGRRAHPLVHDSANAVRSFPGDVRTMSITPAWAEALSDGELAAQLGLIDSHLSTLPPGGIEYQSARENQHLLQQEQVRRLAKGGTESTPEETTQSRHIRFQQGVLLAARHRLTQNQESLAQWRALIESQMQPRDLQTQVLAQSAADLETIARARGGTPAFEAWAGQPNPHMRNVHEHQARGEWRACTGCHMAVEAAARGAEEQHIGPAWISPAERLGNVAGVPGSPRPFPDFGAASAARVRAAVERIRPVVAPLGDQGYRIIPDDVFSLGAGMTAEQLRATIMAKIDVRRSNYAELSERIAAGEISYLQLGPVLQDLLPMADADVRRAVQDDIDRERIWSYIKIGGTLILALLSILFPPLGLAMAAIQFSSGYESYRQGENFYLGTGAGNVFTRAQQDTAGTLMASGIVNMAMATAVLAATTPGVLDMAATRAITSSDLAIARSLGQRALSGPIAEAELLQLQQPGLVGRLAHGWADLRQFQVLYRGQGAPTSAIVSPVARQGGVGASQRLYDAMKAQGLTDLEIAGYTARWNELPVPGALAPPGLGGQPLGGVGIPTTRLPNIAADFAQTPTGVIYVLRVPKGLAVPAAQGGWGQMSALEQEWVIFHQLPNGTVVRVLPPNAAPPLRFDSPAAGGPVLTVPPVVP